MPLLELNFFCHQRNELPMAQVRTFFPTPLLFFASFLRFFPNTSFLTLLDFLAFSRHSCRECSGFFLAPLSWQFFLASLSWLFWRHILALTTHPLGADVWEPIRVVDHETEHNSVISSSNIYLGFRQIKKSTEPWWADKSCRSRNWA